jgi:hypothetical protein
MTWSSAWTRIHGDRRDWWRCRGSTRAEIFGRARANSLAARKLHKNLERLHRGDGADREIVVDEDMRQALLLILVAIEADGLLLTALVELREAAGSPILGG